MELRAYAKSGYTALLHSENNVTMLNAGTKELLSSFYEREIWPIKYIDESASDNAYITL